MRIILHVITLALALGPAAGCSLLEPSAGQEAPAPQAHTQAPPAEPVPAELPPTEPLTRAEAQALVREEVRSQLRDEVRRVLREEPGLVVEAMRARPGEVVAVVEEGVAAKAEIEREARLQAELADPYEPALDGGRPALGPADAPVTIVGYSSFQCHYCVEAHERIEKLLAKYPETIRYVFKHYPAADLAKVEALVFEAIARQDEQAAWLFHDMAFARQDEIAREKEAALDRIVTALGLDQDQFRQDMKDANLARRVLTDMAEFEAFGFEGTPVFLLNGLSVRGARSLEEFEKVLALALGQARSQSDEPSPDDESKQCIECGEAAAEETTPPQ